MLGERYRTVCYVERDPYAVRVLRARMRDGSLDDAPVWGDLRTFYGREWRGVVDLVSAGFPCQPYSTASRGRRVAVDLWPEVHRVIGECLPGGVFLENVSERAIWDAASDLRGLGFTSWITRLSASDLGAPHQRPRWWLLAYHHHATKPVLGLDAEVARVCAAARARWAEHPGRVLGMDDGPTEKLDVATLTEIKDACRQALGLEIKEGCSAGISEEESLRVLRSIECAATSRRPEPPYGNSVALSELPFRASQVLRELGPWTEAVALHHLRHRTWEAQSKDMFCTLLVRAWEAQCAQTLENSMNRSDRLRCLGNAVAPEVAAVAFGLLQCTAEAELLADACEER